MLKFCFFLRNFCLLFRFSFSKWSCSTELYVVAIWGGWSKWQYPRQRLRFWFSSALRPSGGFASTGTTHMSTSWIISSSGPTLLSNTSMLATQLSPPLTSIYRHTSSILSFTTLSPFDRHVTVVRDRHVTVSIITWLYRSRDCCSIVVTTPLDHRVAFVTYSSLNRTPTFDGHALHGKLHQFVGGRVPIQTPLVELTAALSQKIIVDLIGLDCTKGFNFCLKCTSIVKGLWHHPLGSLQRPHAGFFGCGKDKRKGMLVVVVVGYIGNSHVPSLDIIWIHNMRSELLK